jgi:hypothetical protein
MAVLKNRAKMSTSTTGTGTITLGSAESGYQTFADAGVANSDIVRYVIEDDAAWEIGTGTYTSSGTTLTRTVSESSNSDAALNLSGAAVVFVGATAEDILQPANNLSDLASASTSRTNLGLGTAATTAATAYATAAQGSTADAALPESEVDADIKTLALPANTTISTFGASLVDDANAATARTTLGVAIGSNVQAYSSILQNTTASFLSADETKLDYISVTQAVDLDQMETDIAALANGMVYKGNWDASSGSFPGGGSAQTGWFYYVSVAGTVGGVSFAIGDNIVATTDNASASTFAGNWSKHDQTDAVQAVVGLTGSIAKSALLSALNVEDGATADQTPAELLAAIKTVDVNGTDGINAGTMDGIGLGSITRNNAANKVVRTEAQGHLNVGWINTTSGATTGTITDFYVSTNDTFIRKATNAHVLSQLNVEDGADVTNTSSVTAAGALMDSEVDADIKTFVLPANTTISTFGASLVDDLTASAAQTTLGLGSFTRKFRETSGTAGSASGDWMTVAGSQSGRRRGEVLVSDTDSSDHAFIRIDWLRSYYDTTFTVLSCGGNGNRITGVRVLQETADPTYGWKYLQVYVTTSSFYRVQTFIPADTSGWTGHTAVTPIVQNTITGYSVQGATLSGLDTYPLASHQGILAGDDIQTYGDILVGGTVDGVDIAARDAVLTSTTTTANAALPKAGGTMTGNLSFGDNDKAIFGAGSDLQIYHDPAVGSLIEDTSAGSLILRGSTSVQIEGLNGENCAIFNENGSVRLFYDSVEKLETTSTGIDVTGTVIMDGGSTSGDFTFGDNDKATFGASGDLEVYHDGSNSYVRDTGTGNLILRGSNLQLRGNSTNELYITCVENGTVTLYHNGASKLATSASGIDVTGSVTADSLTVETAQGDISIANSASSLNFDRAGVNYVRATDASGSFRFITGADDFTTDRINIASNGDISFYEDTGATAKFFWDSSAERLGLTGSDYQFYIHQGSNQPWYHRAISNGKYSIYLNGTGDVMTLDTSGNVGIGNSAPTTALDVTGTVTATSFSGGGIPTLFVESSGTATAPNSSDSVAIGGYAVSSGTNSTALGRANAGGTDSFAAAIGSASATYGAQGTGSISIGTLSKATQLAGTAVGYGATSTHQASSAFGTSATTTANNQIALGGSGVTARISGAYTLPTADGTANQVLTTDGSGAVTFATADAGGAGGGGSDEIFWENGQNVTTNYTITNGKNAMSAGPITVDSGVTVTVGAGETWTVV